MDSLLSLLIVMLKLSQIGPVGVPLSWLVCPLTCPFFLWALPYLPDTKTFHANHVLSCYFILSFFPFFSIPPSTLCVLICCFGGHPGLIPVAYQSLCWVLIRACTLVGWLLCGLGHLFSWSYISIHGVGTLNGVLSLAEGWHLQMLILFLISL